MSRNIFLVFLFSVIAFSNISATTSSPVNPTICKLTKRPDYKIVLSKQEQMHLIDGVNKKAHLIFHQVESLENLLTLENKSRASNTIRSIAANRSALLRELYRLKHHLDTTAEQRNALQSIGWVFCKTLMDPFQASGIEFRQKKLTFRLSDQQYIKLAKQLKKLPKDKKTKALKARETVISACERYRQSLAESNSP